MLSLWRGEMCTGSFRMPMDDVGRLLDTLDDGFAEATGEQPAVPAHDPAGTEVIPGTGQYQRPHQAPPAPAQPDDRPTAALAPSDVLVARGNPAPADKLVAYGEATVPRDSQQYGDRPPFGGPQYVEPVQRYAEPAPYADPASQYGDPGAQYSDPAARDAGSSQRFAETGPQDRYPGPRYETGPQEPGPRYGDSGPQEPFAGPQYTGDPFTGPQYIDPAADPFTGPQYIEAAAPASGEPVYQFGEPRRRPLQSTDPLGFPSQPAQQADSYAQPAQPDTYGRPAQQPDVFGQQPDLYGRQPAQPSQPDAYGHQPAQPDLYGRQPAQPDVYGQQPAQPDAYGHQAAQPDSYGQQPAQPDVYGSDGYGSSGYGDRHGGQGGQGGTQGGAQAGHQQQSPQAAGLGTPMHGIPGAGRARSMPTIRDRYASQDGYPAAQEPYPANDFQPYQTPPNPVDPLMSLGTNQGRPFQPDDHPDISRPYVGDPMFSTGERLRPDSEFDDERDRRRDW